MTTPANMPKHRPAEGWPTEDTVISGVPILARVVDICRSRGIPIEDVVAAVKEPEEKWRARDGNGNMHLRGSIAVLVVDDTREVIAVSRRHVALRIKRQTEQQGSARGSQKAKGTGCGSTAPTTVDDLLARAREAGLQVERTTRHWQLSRPDGGEKVTVPCTPSDHRSLLNSVAQIRRVLGVDLRTSAG